MSKISPRQLLFFLAFVAPVGKIVLMPSQLVFYAKNDLLFPALIHYALQTGVVFLVMLLSRRNQTLFEMLRATFGDVGGKICCAILGLFFFFSALLPVLEQKLLVQSVFYDTLPSLLSFLPFFLFSAYLLSKPLSAYGRTWDLLMPVTLVGFLGLMIFSVGEADFLALLPVGASGASGIFRATTSSSSWFFDGALLLTFIGKFKYEKGLAWKSALCYFLGGCAVLFFLAVFYASFSDSAIFQTFAFAKISKYFSGITVLGRIDYLFIFLLSLTMAFYTVIPMRACVSCFRETFSHRGVPALYACTVSAVMLLLSVLFTSSFGTVRDAITGPLFWIFPLFSGLLPCACFLLRRSHEKKI
ncbi:MAG: GerAB/ArcD/ProY family transporter [Clostridia bacterium]|nr:GerAB/ArcD/ProY family transporter [Clostridia bacterium]